jgi:zinc transport system substrate-binding protein
MCDRYGLTQIPVKGLEPDEEPSAKTIENIIEIVNEYNITIIFTEEMVSPEIANKIAEETGARIDTLNPLEGLSEDEVGVEDYISIMKDNFRKIMEANK